jgi:hypothetical protein
MELYGVWTGYHLLFLELKKLSKITAKAAKYLFKPQIKQRTQFCLRLYDPIYNRLLNR